MFTGIIEAFGIIHSIEKQGTNATFWISSPISNELKVDQSVAHNGVCLTVEEVKEGRHRVTAIEETLKKTNLFAWHEGVLVNLERCMTMNGRIDGHIVQGHVDTTAKCIEKKDLDGSWEFRFQFAEEFAALVIEKGSISLNGISLTIFNVTNHSFAVAIIPYTYMHTNIQQIREGSTINLEFDMIGKYVNRMLALGK
ncbi:MAG: riboflavin synthase [Segetibacter sp.]|jgi:riboflavin synthase|nr:riboflavin synthase [Segetibacter sp.]